MIKHNAALRGECRIDQPSADHFHHKNTPHTKNATRHESRLNALLAEFLHDKVAQLLTANFYGLF
ncbi:hypothetical protein, partial [Vibrio vulnificus]|uniref:hypothetical protein n=1 Tax=Vibrio vulnificus TaxID=672 RepID=UPI003F6E10B4